MPKLSDEERKERQREASRRYKAKVKNDPEYKEKNKKRARKNYAADGERRRETAKAWREANASRYKSSRLKHQYGITLQQRDALLDAQDGLCAICKSPNDSKLDWHTDHCHATGKVRGVLCHHCNLMLGHARDNSDVLANAIKYLN